MQFIPQFQDFITLFLSLFIEALPFVSLGVLFSAIIAGVPIITKLLDRLPKDKLITRLIFSFVGFFMPVCECGNVPVAKRLLLQGFSVGDVTSFLLSAPIINPVTLWATWAAFSDKPEIMPIRLIGAFFIAQVISFTVAKSKNQEAFVQKQFQGKYTRNIDIREKFSLKSFLSIFESEFIENTKMLLFGAAIASFVQVILPRDILLTLSSNIVFAIITMMVLAFVVSICANVDAFFALSYASTFPTGAIVAFLLFGPMIDIKILSMLRSALKPQYLIYLTIMVSLLSLGIGLFVNFFTS